MYPWPSRDQGNAPVKFLPPQIKFPVIDSNCTKLALLNTLNKFEEMSMNNKRLCEENTKLIQQILNF